MKKQKSEQVSRGSGKTLDPRKVCAPPADSDTMNKHMKGMPMMKGMK